MQRPLWTFRDTWRWFRPGRCVLCGRFGWVIRGRGNGEHEECWLNSK